MLIYDVGLNHGQDTAAYLAAGHRVIAIDANPQLCVENEIRFADSIKSRRLKILNLGIGPKPGEFPFYVNKHNDDWSSFLEEQGARPLNGEVTPHEIISVKTVPFSVILDIHGMPDYLKVDIEGHDTYCFEPLRTDYRPTYLSFEAQHSMQPWLEKLQAIGFTRFKFVRQNPYGGGSGPFGDHAVDVVSHQAWRSAEAVRKSWDDSAQDRSSWFDVHAAVTPT
jgi:FkbM family methyltransferase